MRKERREMESCATGREKKGKVHFSQEKLKLKTTVQQRKKFIAHCQYVGEEMPLQTP